MRAITTSLEGRECRSGTWSISSARARRCCARRSAKAPSATPGSWLSSSAVTTTAGSRLVASLADTERGLGSGLLARIELWRAALRDPVYTADAAAAADAWRAALGAFVPTSMLTATVVLCGALPPGTVDLPNEAPASVANWRTPGRPRLARAGERRADDAGVRAELGLHDRQRGGVSTRDRAGCASPAPTGSR